MCGDPPTIIIGTSLGYTFGDFVTNTGLIALICLVFVIIYFYICFHRELSGGQADGQAASLNPTDAIENKKDFTVSCIIFAVTVVLLVTHAQTGLTVSAIGTFIGIVTLIAAGRDAMVLIKKVDYKTLLFFIGLFVVVGGLEQTGILEVIAGFIAAISEGNAMLMIAIVLWISAVASAFVDNIPFAATMITIIKSLAASQSSSSLGILRKNWRNRKILYTLPPNQMGTAKGTSELVKPSLDHMTKVGIIVTMEGIIRLVKIIMNTLSLPGPPMFLLV